VWAVGGLDQGGGGVGRLWFDGGGGRGGGGVRVWE